MMDETNPFSPAGASPDSNTSAELPVSTQQDEQSAPADSAVGSPALERFKTCRWRATPDVGDFCTHRDVLPFAGKEGFVADSWCADCAFYKLRRTPKKRERLDFSY